LVHVLSISISGPKFFFRAQHNEPHEPDAAGGPPEVHHLAAEDAKAALNHWQGPDLEQYCNFATIQVQ
jgi:hypothetical protein